MVDRVIRVIVDPSAARAGFAQIAGSAQGVGAAVARTTTAIKGMITLLAANEFIKFSDTAILLRNRIRLVTDSVEELNAVNDELFDLAQDTRTGLEPTVDLYARFARSTEQLGLSQRELIDITRTVNQLIQVSGSTTQEANAGLIQFAQGLASARLQGDELRSVLENVPALAIGLARELTNDERVLQALGRSGEDVEAGFEVAIGALRELGKEGELVPEVVIPALQRLGPAAQEQFDQIQRTTANSFTQLNNSVIRLVDRIDQEFQTTDFATGLIDGVREFVDFLTENIGEIAGFFDDISIAAAGVEDAISFEAIGDLASDVSESFVSLVGNIELFGLKGEEAANILEQRFPELANTLEEALADPIQFIVDAFTQLPANAVAAVRILVFEVLQSFRELQLDLAEGVETIADFFGTSFIADRDIRALQADVRAGERALITLRNEELQTLEDIRESIVKAREERRAAAAEEAERRAQARRDLENAPEGGPTIPERTEAEETAIKNAEKLLETLAKQTEELEAQNRFGEDADTVIRDALISELARAGAAEETVEALRQVSAELDRQQQIAQEIEDQTADADLISTLEERLRILTSEGDERLRILAIQQLSAEADEEQLARVMELIRLIEEAEQAERTRLITLEEIDRELTRGIGEAVGDFVRNLDDGFDAIQQSFSELLTNLAAEIIQNIIVTQFLNNLGNSGTGGGIIGGIVGLFGGGGQPATSGQFGAPALPGVPMIVGEGNRPEIFIPSEPGQIQPMSAFGQDVTVLNILESDPRAPLMALNTQEGVRTNRTFVQEDNRFVRRTLGVR